MRDRAHTADALRDVERVGRLAADEHGLHAAVQTAGGPRVGDDAIHNFNLDAEMTLDTGNGVNDCACHYLSPPFIFLS